MEVILREDVKGLGGAGEVVKVKEGYGRNFLLPRKIAVIADPKNIKMQEHHKKAIEAQQKKEKAQAAEVAAKLSELSITISREAGEEDKIFGSVTAKDISDALRKEGHNFDKRRILLPEPIKGIGVFEVDIKLHSEVNGKVKVWVVKK